MQRSKRIVRVYSGTSAQKGTPYPCQEDVPGNCCSNSEEDESETSSSEDEDEVVYLSGMRVLRAGGTGLGTILQDVDNEDDSTLDQIRDRHSEELDSLYQEMMEEVAISRAIQGLSMPYKSYIEHLREQGRFAGE